MLSWFVVTIRAYKPTKEKKNWRHVRTVTQILPAKDRAQALEIIYDALYKEFPDTEHWKDRSIVDIEEIPASFIELMWETSQPDPETEQGEQS